MPYIHEFCYLYVIIPRVLVATEARARMSQAQHHVWRQSGKLLPFSKVVNGGYGQMIRRCVALRTRQKKKNVGRKKVSKKKGMGKTH